MSICKTFSPRAKSLKEITRWWIELICLFNFLKIRSSKHESRNKYELHKYQIQNMSTSCKYCLTSRNVLIIWYLNFDIISHFDIRISDLSPVICRANPPDFTKLETTLTLPFIQVQKGFVLLLPSKGGLKNPSKFNWTWPRSPSRRSRECGFLFSKRKTPLGDCPKAFFILRNLF